MTHVPQIPGLKVNQILEEARKHSEIDEYIPNLKNGKLPNKDDIVNVSKESVNI